MSDSSKLGDRNESDEPSLARLRPSRRGFIATAAAALAAGCAPTTGADSSEEEDWEEEWETDEAADSGKAPRTAPGVTAPEKTKQIAKFGMGIAAGDAMPNAIVLWTRYDGAEELEVVVYEMQRGVYAAEVAAEIVTPDPGSFVNHEIRNLSPGSLYRYAFFERKHGARTGRSAIGRFRTAFAPASMRTFTLAAVCCTDASYEKKTLAHIAKRSDIDLLVVMGDATYNDNDVTFEQYRFSWETSLRSAGWMSVRRSLGLVSTWDDHEIANNYNPEEVDAAPGKQAFLESLPRRVEANPQQIYKSFRWGMAAEVIVLDCRSERLPSTIGGEDIYLSKEQMRWLKRTLTDSPCTYKIIVNAAPIGDFPVYPDPEDRWMGFTRQRNEILNYIDDSGVQGVLWLSGDFHFASVGRVSPEGPGANQWEVLTGPAANYGIPVPVTDLRVNQFDWWDSSMNYLTLSMDPALPRIIATWFGEDGEIMHKVELPIWNP